MINTRRLVDNLAASIQQVSIKLACWPAAAKDSMILIELLFESGFACSGHDWTRQDERSRRRPRDRVGFSCSHLLARLLSVCPFVCLSQRDWLWCWRAKSMLAGQLGSLGHSEHNAAAPANRAQRQSAELSPAASWQCFRSQLVRSSLALCWCDADAAVAAAARTSSSQRIHSRFIRVCCALRAQVRCGQPSRTLILAPFTCSSSGSAGELQVRFKFARQTTQQSNN